MEHISGLVGFIFGTIVAQFAGGWTYRRVKQQSSRKAPAAVASGLVTAVVAAIVYVPFGVEDWLAGDGSDWAICVFLGLCMGIIQGTLFPGGPLAPRA